MGSISVAPIPGSFPRQFWQLPVTDNIPIGYKTKWTAFLGFWFVCFFCLIWFFTELGPKLKSCETLSLRNGPLVSAHV